MIPFLSFGCENKKILAISSAKIENLLFIIL